MWCSEHPFFKIIQRGLHLHVNYISRSISRIARLTAKTLHRKFETNIPKNETGMPRSQFLHSCFGERFIYSHYRSAYSATENRWTNRRNKSIAHRYMNVEIRTEAVQFLFEKYINRIFFAVWKQKRPRSSTVLPASRGGNGIYLYSRTRE